MVEYKIQDTTLIAIADEVRRLANKTGELSPQQIIAYLKQIRSIPSSIGESGLSIRLSTAASGIIPTVYRGSGIGILSETIGTTARGSVTEET